MDRKDYISSLPVKVLARILKFVPKENHLFTLSKHFYEAACLASKSDYRFKLDGNATIQNCFDNIVASKRVFHDFVIEYLHMPSLSEDDVGKFLKILTKFGGDVRNLAINFDVIAEDDIRAMLSFFPHIERLSIKRKHGIKGIVPPVILKQNVQSLVFSKLSSIIFESNILKFKKIFNFTMTRSLRKLDVDAPELYSCFQFLNYNRQIEYLWFRSPTFYKCLPIGHLKLKYLLFELPKAKRLIPLVAQQTQLCAFNLINYRDDNVLINPNASFSESSDSDTDLEVDIDVLKAATKMKNLEELKICINEIPRNHFFHFTKLVQLEKLIIRSTNVDKVSTFSTVAMPNVTTLLLYFKDLAIPKCVLENIAKNFPKVTELLCQTESLCDAFIRFSEHMPQLEKLTIIRSHDYNDEEEQYVASDSTTIKVNFNLKMFTLYLSYPDEANVHKFMIRLALTAPNIESLEIIFDSLKIVPNNLIYILRNFKQLKNISANFNLYPDEKSAASQIGTYDNKSEYSTKMEVKIIKILSEFGSGLDYVQLNLRSPHYPREKLWKDSFAQQFASIQVKCFDIWMKKDMNMDVSELFAQSDQFT